MSFQLHKELATDLFLISLPMLMTVQKTENNADICEQQDDTGSSTLMCFIVQWKTVWKQSLNSNVNPSILCFCLVKSFYKLVYSPYHKTHLLKRRIKRFSFNDYFSVAHLTIYLTALQLCLYWEPWMAQSVKPLTLGLGLGHDLTVGEFKPHLWALHWECRACVGFSFSLSLPFPCLCTCTCACSLSK